LPGAFHEKKKLPKSAALSIEPHPGILLCRTAGRIGPQRGGMKLLSTGIRETRLCAAAVPYGLREHDKACALAAAEQVGYNSPSL